MTFVDLQTAVQRRLGRERFWDLADIKTMVNQAYIEVCEHTNCYEAETTISLVAGQTYYELEEGLLNPSTPGRMSIDEFGINIDGTFDELKRMRFTTVGFAMNAATPYTAILIPLRIWNPITRVWLDITTVSILDRNYPRWGTSDGAPDRWFMRGYATLGIYPRPSTISATNPQTLVLRHSALPLYLEADDDVTVIPRQYEDTIVLGAVWRLKAIERETKAALKAWKEYVEARELLVEYVQDRMRRGHIDTYGGSQVVARR